LAASDLTSERRTGFSQFDIVRQISFERFWRGRTASPAAWGALVFTTNSYYIPKPKVLVPKPDRMLR
jgi:hypothetical protein